MNDIEVFKEGELWHIYNFPVQYHSGHVRYVRVNDMLRQERLVLGAEYPQGLIFEGMSATAARPRLHNAAASSEQIQRPQQVNLKLLDL